MPVRQLIPPWVHQEMQTALLDFLGHGSSLPLLAIANRHSIEVLVFRLCTCERPHSSLTARTQFREPKSCRVSCRMPRIGLKVDLYTISAWARPSASKMQSQGSNNIGSVSFGEGNTAHLTGSQSIHSCRTTRCLQIFKNPGSGGAVNRGAVFQRSYQFVASRISSAGGAVCEHLGRLPLATYPAQCPSYTDRPSLRTVGSA